MLACLDVANPCKNSVCSHLPHTEDTSVRAHTHAHDYDLLFVQMPPPNLRSPWTSQGLTDRVVNSINTRWWAIICPTQLEKWSSEKTWQAVSGHRGWTDRRNEIRAGWGFVRSFCPFIMNQQMHFSFLRGQTEGDISWRLGETEVETFKCLSTIRLHNESKAQLLPVIYR